MASPEQKRSRIFELSNSEDPDTQRKFKSFLKHLKLKPEQLEKLPFLIDLYEDFVPPQTEAEPTKERKVTWLQAREDHPVNRDIILRQLFRGRNFATHGEMPPKATEPISFPEDEELLPQFVGLFYNSSANGLPRKIVSIKRNPGDHFSQGKPYYQTKTVVAQGELPNHHSPLWYHNFIESLEEK